MANFAPRSCSAPSRSFRRPRPFSPVYHIQRHVPEPRANAAASYILLQGRQPHNRGKNTSTYRFPVY